MSESNSQREQLVQVRFPLNSEILDDIALAWTDDLTNEMLELVWRAYDLLVAEVLSVASVNINQPLGDLERSITEMLELRIHRLATGDEPYTSQHESWERERWKGGNARPKQYDIAFVWNSLERIKWPLEAKVLSSPTDVGEYVKDIRDEFETCGYAPFVSGGGMIGYLRAGDPALVFPAIESALLIVLHAKGEFSKRFHRWSEHTRAVPQGKSYPVRFRCEHMIMPLSR